MVLAVPGLQKGRPMTRPLPPQRQKVMDFIAAELRAGREFPSKQAVADHMGWKSPLSAYDALQKLCFRDGVLTRDIRGQYQVRV